MLSGFTACGIFALPFVCHFMFHAQQLFMELLTVVHSVSSDPTKLRLWYVSVADK